MYSFFFNNSRFGVFSVVMSLFLFCGCISPDTKKTINDYYQNKLSFDRRGTPEYVQFRDHKVPHRDYHHIPLANTTEIKLLLYSRHIQSEIDNGINYQNNEYRFIWEPDFDFIAEILRKKYPGIKLVHGRQSFPAPELKNKNIVIRKIPDGLDYSYSYLIKHNVVMMQIGEMFLSDNGQEIRIVVILSYPGGGSSGEVYSFRKEGDFWFFYLLEESIFSS